MMEILVISGQHIFYFLFELHLLFKNDIECLIQKKKSFERKKKRDDFKDFLHKFKQLEQLM